MLVNILKPIVGNTKNHCKNYTHYTEDINNITIKDEEMLFSTDVVSLFTNVPITKALIVIKDRLKKHETLKNSTTFSVKDMNHCLKVCHDNHFISLYKKIKCMRNDAPLPLVPSHLRPVIRHSNFHNITYHFCRSISAEGLGIVHVL